MEDKVSVVIPICSPDKEFVTLVTRLMKQTVVPDEIIIVNTKRYFDGSTLIMDEIYEKLAIDIDDNDLIKVYEIKPEEYDHGATRDFGIAQTRNKYVLMMTQDAIPKNSMVIEKLLDAMKDEDVAIAYARQLPKYGCNYVEAYTRKFNYPNKDIVKTIEDVEKMGIKAIFNSDVCALYDKEKYNICGGFPARLIFGEDAIMAYKALTNGYKVVYSSQARVLHSHNYTLLQYFRRNFDIGVGHVQNAYIYDKLSSESEGIKLVKDTAMHLYNKKRYLDIPVLVAQSGSKFLGYKLGKMFKILPKKVVEFCSMNKGYWKRGN